MTPSEHTIFLRSVRLASTRKSRVGVMIVHWGRTMEPAQTFFPTNRVSDQQGDGVAIRDLDSLPRQCLVWGRDQDQ